MNHQFCEMWILYSCRNFGLFNILCPFAPASGKKAVLSERHFVAFFLLFLLHLILVRKGKKQCGDFVCLQLQLVWKLLCEWHVVKVPCSKKTVEEKDPQLFYMRRICDWGTVKEQLYHLQPEFLRRLLSPIYCFGVSFLFMKRHRSCQIL